MRPLHLFLFCVSTVFFPACDILQEDEKATPAEYENELLPEHNDLILAAASYGNDINSSRFIYVEPSSTAGFYALGSLNNSQSAVNVAVGDAESIDYYDAALVKFDPSGKKLWETQPGFSPYRHLVIPAGVLGSMEYILVTGYDENEDNPSDPDRNRFMLFDQNGVFISNLSADFSLRLNGIQIIENNSTSVKILVVGSVFKTAPYKFYPAYCTVSINKSTRQLYDFDPTQIIDNAWENVIFQNIDYSNGKYVVSGYVNDGNPDNEKYIGVHVSTHSNTNLQTAIWRRTIDHNSSNKEIYHWRRCMHVYDGKVYLSGYLEDTNKSKTSAGTHWVSPFLYCYNVSNGSQVFKKTYPKSTRSDKFYDIADHNGSILVSGISSQSYCSTCSKEFTVGNAWMNRINAQTGELMSQKTFGNPTHSTWISQFCITNNSLWGVGYLNYTNQSGLGWVVKINPDNI